MVDKGVVLLVAKVLAAIVAIVLFFTVIIPRFNELNEIINVKTKAFLELFLAGTMSISQKDRVKKHDFVVDDIEESEKVFSRRFTSGFSDADIEHAIGAGEFLLKVNSASIEIRSRLAFLYYLRGDYGEAKDNYMRVLKSVSGRKRIFKYLKKSKKYHSFKRSLLGLAAVYYEQGKFGKMVDYYTKFLRATQRDDIFREISKGGIKEERAKVDIFSKISGEGLLSYRKSIEVLEELQRIYPNNNRIIYELGIKNFELVNLIFGRKDIVINGNLYDAEKYLQKSLEFVPEYEQKVIQGYLEQLEKIKEDLKNSCKGPKASPH